MAQNWAFCCSRPLCVVSPLWEGAASTGCLPSPSASLSRRTWPSRPAAIHLGVVEACLRGVAFDDRFQLRSAGDRMEVGKEAEVLASIRHIDHYPICSVWNKIT
jgi:hypothetical protein